MKVNIHENNTECSNWYKNTRLKVGSFHNLKKINQNNNT